MLEGDDDLLEAMGKWVDRHPTPTEPVLFLAGRTYTPSEILQEMRYRTEFGKLQMGLIRKVAEEMKFVSVREFIDQSGGGQEWQE